MIFFISLSNAIFGQWGYNGVVNSIDISKGLNWIMKRQLIVTLETVTPMFLAGADPTKPELRAPSIVGELRYWLRAALGGVLGDNLDTLKQAEAEVFGDTNGTGAVSVRIPYVELKTDRWNPLPHKDKMSKFEGFKEGQRFDICLTQRDGNDNTWLAAISALLLMVSIGGLGRRCRRGWGTVRIVRCNFSQANLDEGWQEILNFRPNSDKAWNNYLRYVLQATQIGIEKLSEQFGKRQSISLPTAYTITLSEYPIPLFVLKLYSNYTEAITDFGQIEHTCLGSGQLPVQSVGYVNPTRQASPLWIRVLPIGKSQYILLATLFNVNFKGSDYQAVKKFLTNQANFKEIPL